MSEITIRQAVTADLGAMVELGELFYSMSPLSCVALYDKKAAFDTLSGMLINQNTWILLAHHGEKLVGGIGFVQLPIPFVASGTFIQELFWFVQPDSRASGIGLQLFLTAEDIARRAGASLFFMSAFTSVPALHKLYQSLGFFHTECSFTKVL